MNDIDKDMADRLVVCVSKKLGVAVGFDRWIKSTKGDVPVFIVPPQCRAQAQELGLTVA